MPTGASIPNHSPLFRPAVLRRWRERAGLTQRDLARVLRCHRSWIAQIENGAVPPPRRFIESLHLAFPDTRGLLGVEPEVRQLRERDERVLLHAIEDAAGALRAHRPGASPRGLAATMRAWMSWRARFDRAVRDQLRGELAL